MKKMTYPIMGVLGVLASVNAFAAAWTNVVQDVEGNNIEIEWTYSGSGENAKLTKMTPLQETSGLEITIPNAAEIGVTLATIGNNAFRNNTVIQKATLPDFVKKIEGSGWNGNEGGFSKCTSLTHVVMPGVTEVAAGGFGFCSNLEFIEMPALQKIGYRGFYGCSKLSGDFVLENLTELGGFAFASTKINSIQLPKITSIGGSAFSSCTQLTNCVAPLVTSIGGSAFFNCYKLENFPAPMKNIVSIGGQAFEGCGALTGDLSFPKLTSLSDRAFDRCAKITSVNLPLVPEVFGFGGGNSTFISCSSLTNAIMPCVRKIGIIAFRGCSKINFVYIPSVTNIVQDAFSSTLALKEIKLPYCMETIGSNAFKDSGLTNILVHVNSPLAASDDEVIKSGCAAATVTRYGGTVAVDGINWIYDDCDTPDYSPSAKSRTLVAAPAATGDVVIPDALNDVKVTAIEACAFRDTVGLTSVKVPKKVTRIGVCAFPAGCNIKIAKDAPQELKNALEEEYPGRVSEYSGSGMVIIIR